MPPSPSKTLDRYRPLYAVGRGGMGVVEVALEQGENGFERVCALKRLLPEGARDKRHTEMFLREARLAALLSHPNVVHGFAFGEVDGEFFLAMEYVEGETLSRLLTTLREKKETLLASLAAFIVAEICEGLHAVHELKDEAGAQMHVVHRDVSPHNVMIAYEAGLKLLDFGVAKIEAEPGLTRTGEVKGKTAYMSPEQAMGEAALDLRSDLYSVGAVLFECVSGRKMWEGTEMEVLRHLALDEPPKLEDAAPNAPAELCALYTKLVSKNRDDRPSSAQAVARELRAFADSHETTSGTDALRALMKRHFAADAVKRKSELERALAVAAPSEADVLADDLRASLTLETSPDRKSHSEIVASVQSRREEKRPFLPTILVVAVIFAIVGASFLAMHARGEEIRERLPAVADPSTSLSNPGAPAANSASAATPSATAIASATPTPSATHAARSPAHDQAAKIAPTANPSSEKHSPKPPNLDVDPNPI